MRNIIGLSLCLIIIAFGSCKNESASNNPDFKTYKSDSLGISMEYPKGYELKEYFNQYVPVAFFKTITDSSDTQYPENVLLYIEPIPTTVIVPFEDFILGAKTKLKLEMPDIEISDEDSINIDGIPTGVYTMRRPKIGGADFKSKMYIMVEKHRAINISCTSTADKFDNELATFDKIVMSTKISKSK